LKKRLSIVEVYRERREAGIRPVFLPKKKPPRSRPVDRRTIELGSGTAPGVTNAGG
jgi:hypothetical protein